MTALEIVRKIESAGGVLMLNGDRITYDIPKNLLPLIDALREVKPEAMRLLQERCEAELDELRASFVEWLDGHCTLSIRDASSVDGLHRLYLAEVDRPCTRAQFKQMLAELCFPIREVCGTELVQGLVLREDREAVLNWRVQ